MINCIYMYICKYSAVVLTLACIYVLTGEGSVEDIFNITSHVDHTACVHLNEVSLNEVFIIIIMFRLLSFYLTSCCAESEPQTGINSDLIFIRLYSSLYYHYYYYFEPRSLEMLRPLLVESLFLMTRHHFRNYRCKQD